MGSRRLPRQQEGGRQRWTWSVGQTPAEVDGETTMGSGGGGGGEEPRQRFFLHTSPLQRGPPLIKIFYRILFCKSFVECAIPLFGEHHENFRCLSCHSFFPDFDSGGPRPLPLSVRFCASLLMHGCVQQGWGYRFSEGARETKHMQTATQKLPL